MSVKRTDHGVRLTAGRRQSGFTLIELMVAVVIFSIGLIGLGATMALSIRSNNTAVQRTQAIFLAEALADMMRANDRGMWALAYDGAYPTGGSANCDAGCTFQQIAVRDQDLWSQMLQQTLPGAAAQVQCAMNGGRTPGVGIRRPPSGLCTITMSWSENVDAEGQASGLNQQTFAWAFNP
ncbi:MAG: type IV pilus modification protein PilV [Xanthomonadales bacterium]|nr:type IV pilus modification protein PilV [Xanthomonadales bacterium]